MTNGLSFYAERLLEDNEHKIRTLRRVLQDRKALLKQSASITAALGKFTNQRKRRRRATD